jgi:hypothetical protein
MAEKSGKIQIGYVKDVLGASGFLVATLLLFFIEDLNKYRKVIFFTLILCFVMDFYFGTDKDYHCMEVGDNKPTKCIVFGGLYMMILFILVSLNKVFKLF